MMDTSEIRDEAHRLDDLILAGKVSEAELRREIAAFTQAEVAPDDAGLHHRLVEALNQTMGWRGEH